MSDVSNGTVGNISPLHSKSFMGRISDAVGVHPLAQFRAFPADVEFIGQDTNEQIVLVVRQHVVMFVKPFLITIGLVLVMILSIILTSEFLLEPGQVLYLSIGVALFCILLSITVLFSAFIRWFYTVSVITTQRVVDMDFNNLIHHTFVEAQLEKIERVFHESTTLWSSVFDYGNVFVQTAGMSKPLSLMNITRPRDISDTIYDLLELKQKGEI